MAQRSEKEGNFNIFYQLIAGADDQLTADLLLDISPESEEKNLYIEPYDDVSCVCVCVCVCVFVCVCTRAHACVHVWVCTREYMCVLELPRLIHYCIV